MKLNPIGLNQTILETDKATILFSYQTPVCAAIHGHFYRTSQKWSKTTSKHITNWLAGRDFTVKDQSFFDDLIK